LSERVSAAEALAMYVGSSAAPGLAPRRVETGMPADLGLLKGPLREALAAPAAGLVAATLIGGRLVYQV
jgi:hypothetical protein